MKRKVKILCAFFAGIILVLSGVVITIGVLDSEDQVKENLKAAGSMDFSDKAGLSSNKKTSQIAYIGNNIEIYQEDIDKTVQKMMLAYDDESEAETEAIGIIALRSIFYDKAKKENLLGSEDDFLRWLQDYKESIEGASNYEDFETYILGTGMTVDEYWETLETDPDVRVEYYSNKYAEHLQSEFASSEGISMNDPSFYERWSEYYLQYQNDVLEQEDLRPLQESESNSSQETSS